jgi:3-dehydroquinate synthase
MKSLVVDLAERSYPIYIGGGLLKRLQELEHWHTTTQILIVTNSTVAPIYLDRIKSTLKSVQDNIQIEAVILPDGEQHKNWITLNFIYDALLQHKYERGCLLIALGGGVVGDMTGFAAATYQRGVNFVQIPTTLLSQVDSSVGGKTGINHPLGKNMIGAFYQPKSVIIDIDTLVTLPDREFSAGLAEVIKYGLIGDADFFSWIEQNVRSILDRQPDALMYIIERSCLNKALIVASDEKESGNRALLNFGHTFGHAIETHQGYGNWLHGEAVAAGMMIAARLSQQLGWLSDRQCLRIQAVLQKMNLPVHVPDDMAAIDFYEKMQIDKKVTNGKIRFILLKDIGKATIESNITQQKVIAAINLCLV